MNYKEYVDQGKHLALLEEDSKDCRWEWGDLIVKAFAEDKLPHIYDESSRYANAKRKALATHLMIISFAKVCGFKHAPSTLYRYYITARAWPKKDRKPEMSWSAHKVLNNTPGKVNLPDMTNDEASLHVGNAPHSRYEDQGRYRMTRLEEAGNTLQRIADDLDKVCKSILNCNTSTMNKRQRARVLANSERSAGYMEAICDHLVQQSDSPEYRKYDSDRWASS